MRKIKLIVNSILSGYQRIADYNGRTNRAEYIVWISYLLLFIVATSAMFLDATNDRVFRLYVGLPLVLCHVAVTLSLQQRRVNDMGEASKYFKYWFLLIWLPPLFPIIVMLCMIFPSGQLDSDEIKRQPTITSTKKQLRRKHRIRWE